MTRPLMQMTLMVLLSGTAITLAILRNGWSWPLMALAALPVALWGLAIAIRRSIMRFCDLYDEHSAEI